MRTLGVALLVATLLPFGSQGTLRTVALSGRDQKLHLYGTPSGPPIILSSGDGGWLHLAPHLADVFAAAGYFVVGFDTKAYLSNASGSGGSLTPDDISRDYQRLLTLFATGRPAVLAGVSEGAGLSIVAAADPGNHDRVAGVMTFGLGERNELAWHWRDAVIYFTKGVPSEPAFSASAFIPRVSPLPLAFVRSSRDEFVSREESDRLIAAARAPVFAWTVAARDHRFSDNLAALDRIAVQAMHWISANRS